MTPERLRTLRRAGITTGFGLVVFVIAFYLMFPFERIKEQIIAALAAQNMDVEIGDVGPAFGIGMAFADVQVKTRPVDGSKPTQVRIDSAKVTLSLLAQLQGESAYSVSANALGGQMDLDWLGSKAKGEFHIRVEDVAMASLPGVREAINLPLGGTLGLSLDVTSPNNRNAAANGSVSWKCAACVIGDGKEKLKIAGNPLMSEGIGLPKIRLGDFVGRIAIDKGTGKFQGVQGKSPDGEVLVEGEVRLADPLPSSYLDIYVRFRLSDALLKSSDKVQLMLQLAESSGKRPDGYFGFRLSGTISRLTSFQWAKTSPFASSLPAAASRPAGSRPGATPRPSGASSPPSSTLPLALPSEPPPPASPVVPGRPPTLPPNPTGADPSAPTVDPLKDPGANLPAYPSLPPPSTESAAPAVAPVAPSTAPPGPGTPPPPPVVPQ